MGMFSFIRKAGEKLTGGTKLDEGVVREHVLAQGLKLNPFSVVTDPAAGKVTLIGYALTLEDKEKAIVAAGNIDGVETVEDRIKIGVPEWLARKQAQQNSAAPAAEQAKDEDTTPSSAEQPTARFYTVKSGDTLSKIAKEMYGNASQYPQIFEANKPMLKHPDKIYPGQVLRIP